MTQQIKITLDELRRLDDRIENQALESGDWPILRALVSQLITRAQKQQIRMLAKLQAAEPEVAQGPEAFSDESSHSTVCSDENIPEKKRCGRILFEKSNRASEWG